LLDRSDPNPERSHCKCHSTTGNEKFPDGAITDREIGNTVRELKKSISLTVNRQG
jgi:hypothetical protein